MSISSLSRNIVNGPNRDRLIDAFKYAYDEERLTPGFAIYVGKTVDMDGTERIITNKITDITISSLQHESGSGDTFNFDGWCSVALYFGGKEKKYTFSGYYNARTRKGVMNFKE